MKLIVGLGNYGEEYYGTRHNMGFMVVDSLAQKMKIEFKKTKGDSYLHAVKNVSGETIMLIKPLTYMNLSGNAVMDAMDTFDLNIEDIVVISDDMDLVPGQIRLRKSGSSGHQKGLQNIIDCLKTEDFKRIRIGIGRPMNKDNINYVLGKPSQEESVLLKEAISNATDAIMIYLHKGFDVAMSTYKTNKK